MQNTNPSVLGKVDAKVTHQMNDMLISPFSSDDVHKVVFSIGDLKAAAADGLHVVFF